MQDFIGTSTAPIKNPKTNPYYTPLPDISLMDFECYGSLENLNRSWGPVPAKLKHQTKVAQFKGENHFALQSTIYIQAKVP